MRRREFAFGGALLLLTACGGGGAPATGGPEPTSGAGPATAASTGGNPTATGVATTRAGATRTSTVVGAVIPPATGTITTVTRTPVGTARATASAARPLPSAPPVAFGPAPWMPGERTNYTVTTRDGQPAGTATFTLGGEFEAATISASLLVGGTQDRYQIGFDARTFAPASELRSIVTPQGTVDIRAEYHAGGATIEVIDRNGTTRNQLTLPPVYYANDQFLVILRALPFAEGYQGAMQIVPSQGNPPNVAVVVAVVGREDVTTPAGTFPSWRVEASQEDSAAQQVLWYAVEKPHYLVRYETSRFVYVLAQRPA